MTLSRSITSPRLSEAEMFDGVLSSESCQSSIVLNRPSMGALSYILRHQENWPTGFQWDFSNCGTCAMGLCCALWDESSQANTAWFGRVAELLEIPTHDAFTIFIRPNISVNGRGHSNVSRITPEMIADEIDHYIVKHVR